MVNETQTNTSLLYRYTYIKVYRHTDIRVFTKLLINIAIAS